MRNIITNKLFQITVVGGIAAYIGYTFLGTSTSVDQDALETTVSATIVTEITDAVDATNNTENTGANQGSSTTPVEETTETTENQ
jgi:hypothetical protein